MQSAVFNTLETAKVKTEKVEKSSAPLEEPESSSFVYNNQDNFMNEIKPLNNEEVKNISNSFEKLDINGHPDDTNCSSDTDNQSIISISYSNSSMSSNEFFVVPQHSEEIPIDHIKQEPELSDGIEVIEHVNSENDSNNNNAEVVSVEHADPTSESTRSISSEITLTADAEENLGITKNIT